MVAQIERASVAVVTRRATMADAAECGRICHDAFKSIADQHHFPPDFTSVAQAEQVISYLLSQPTFFGVVAEVDGRLVGSNFLSMGDPVHAVGPISVDPRVQNRGIGRRLMETVLHRARTAVGVRLVQDAFNTASMALYVSLGFEVREPLALLTGCPVGPCRSGFEVRPLRRADIDACARLCERVHGTERTRELLDALDSFTPFVVYRDGRITAYATTLSLWQVAHGVAESETDMQQLILGASRNDPLAFLVPTRQSSLLRWCVSAGLRIVKPLTLMTMGAYREPSGCYFPSVAY
jgi:ribosomal protein S18 acetylase RimI-like enzyme